MADDRKNLKFAVLGTGFWSLYQIPAWLEVGGVQLVAVCNRTVEKAEQVARRFGVPRVYSDAEELLKREYDHLDFVDIITAVETHAHLVSLAARYKLPVICQKPMSTDLTSAEMMVAECKAAGVPLYIHENWRWQTPIRALKQALDSGEIGRPFRARIDMISGYPVFENQPFLKELEQFIITDLGSHILDTARYLFGEASSLYCQTRRVHQDIKGEDVATIVLNMGENISVTVNMAYAGNPLEREAFPQTFIFVEGDRGSLELSQDYWLRTTTHTGTLLKRVPPPRYSWIDPAYEVVHASIVACNANLLGALKGEGRAETTGEDNLKTVRLVFASYDSASQDQVIHF
uniref:Gfo/Idh/MocA family oxidoreductase n=1 Tax=Anaerolinea thermolimosa TaxID=229919 RepID=A0A7C4KHF7_9CHLR